MLSNIDESRSHEVLSCNQCLKILPLSRFRVRKDRPRGYEYMCMKCHYAINVKNKKKRKLYFIQYYRDWNRGERQRRLVEVGGENMNNCMICGKEFENGKEKHIDHCHATGKTRGILCRGCNVGLGNFKDDEGLMLKAIAYLRLHKENADWIETQSALFEGMFL